MEIAVPEDPGRAKQDRLEGTFINLLCIYYNSSRSKVRISRFDDSNTNKIIQIYICLSEELVLVSTRTCYVTA